MPSLTISNTQPPTEFFYQDSGAPDRQVYTTLVVVHGLYFHSASFQHAIPLATPKGFRMVCLNRRDYPGTTPYTPAEFKAASEGGADEHAAFLKARGVEFASFLDGLIDALSLPEPTLDGKEGGLALMGWSMGNMFTLGTLAAVSSLQPRVQSRLQLYLRKLIVFEAPSQALGIPGAITPAMDHTTPPQELWLRSCQWMSSYFAHGDLSTRNFGDIEFLVPDLNKKSVAASLSPQEFGSVTDYEAGARSDIFLFKSQTLLFDQMRKALFDPETRSLWPRLGIWFLHCDSSAGVMIHAAWEVEKLAKEHEDQPILFLTIVDAHHLVFWDEPEKAVEAFDHCLRH